MDIVDDAQRQEAAELGVRLLEQRRAAALDAPGAEYCSDCQEEIPLERRRALPSAIRCVTCQEFFERLRLNNRNGRTP